VRQDVEKQIKSLDVQLVRPMRYSGNGNAGN
jgi:hypothetical protein